MKLKVLVNGKEAERFHLTISKDSDNDGFCGDIHAIFGDGSEIKGRIRREITIPQLHPFQHIYELEDVKVAVEYLDDEGKNLVT